MFGGFLNLLFSSLSLLHFLFFFSIILTLLSIHQVVWDHLSCSPIWSVLHFALNMIWLGLIPVFFFTQYSKYYSLLSIMFCLVFKIFILNYHISSFWTNWEGYVIFKIAGQWESERLRLRTGWGNMGECSLMRYFKSFITHLAVKCYRPDALRWWRLNQLALLRITSFLYRLIFNFNPSWVNSCLHLFPAPIEQQPLL